MGTGRKTADPRSDAHLETCVHHPARPVAHHAGHSPNHRTSGKVGPAAIHRRIPAASGGLLALPPQRPATRTRPCRRDRTFTPFVIQILILLIPPIPIGPHPFSGSASHPQHPKFHRFFPARHKFAHIAQYCGIIRIEHTFAFAKQDWPFNRLPAARSAGVRQGLSCLEVK
jgi:hypothetical protein